MPSTISGINGLQRDNKRDYYTRVILPELLDFFHIHPSLKDEEGNDLLNIKGPFYSSNAEVALYHVAVIFERHGFTYQKGRRLMQNIDTKFSTHDDLRQRLNNNNPFCSSSAINSVSLRSWAIPSLGLPCTNT